MKSPAASITSPKADYWAGLNFQPLDWRSNGDFPPLYRPSQFTGTANSRAVFVKLPFGWPGNEAMALAIRASSYTLDSTLAFGMFEVNGVRGRLEKT
jgi:hypothetical protein